MERKLASIQCISAIEPIPDADRIEVVHVLGWQCVSKRGEFSVGDLCVYFEIDSILPDIPEFEFMRARKFRVRTIKLRGTLSQGLAMPMSILNFPSKWLIGDDVTEELGVVKHDPEADVSYQRERVVHIPWYLKPFKRLIAAHPYLKHRFGHLVGISRSYGFPAFLHKTDEPRIQSNPGFLRYITPDRKLFITQKVDGTSGSYYYNEGVFGICSRNLEVYNTRYPKHVKSSKYRDVSESYNIHSKLKSVGRNICTQAEIAGPGIQGNKLELSTLKLFIFNVYDIDKQSYFDYEDMIAFCKDLELPTVQIIDNNVMFKSITIDELLQLAKGTYACGNPQEGIVIRPHVEETLHGLGRFSFKVVNNDFLLKYGD